MKNLKKSELSKLELVAYNWINSYKDKGYKSKESLINDLMRNGCVSGMVNDLIYYSDTTAFFNEHKEEINEMLKDAIENIGTSVSDVFGNKWDNSDPLCLDTQNQNLLAWFGFEESVRIIADKMGIEV